ncbi:MAG: hypothetical protein ISS51_03480 [Dehalococcoidales bacterium]|nr:hypothetical protein [Dehalococcoidales bacterium]
MKDIAIQGDKRKPNTAPTLTKVKIISKLCNQTLGLKSHTKPAATEIREATRSGEVSPRTINIPQENKKVNIILKAILSMEMGTRKRIAPSKTTTPKK